MVHSALLAAFNNRIEPPDCAREAPLIVTANEPAVGPLTGEMDEIVGAE